MFFEPTSNACVAPMVLFLRTCLGPVWTYGIIGHLLLGLMSTLAIIISDPMVLFCHCIAMFSWGTVSLNPPSFHAFRQETLVFSPGTSKRNVLIKIKKLSYLVLSFAVYPFKHYPPFPNYSNMKATCTYHRWPQFTFSLVLPNQ